MYVLITYDVNTTQPEGAKRLRQVAKACQDHGQRVQNSVFECLITSEQLVRLEHRLNQIIDPQVDSLRFYHLGNNYKSKIKVIGVDRSMDLEGSLIY